MRTFFLSLLRKSFPLALIVLLLAAASFAQLNVSSPVDGSTLASPVHFVASGSAPITEIQIYVDDNQTYAIHSNQLDTYVTMSVGSHYCVVQSWDSSGNITKVIRNVTVGSSSGGGGSSSGNSISISSPADGSTVGSPVHFVANSSVAVAMHLYIDGSLAYRVQSGQIDTSLAVGSGTHNIVFVGWDTIGNVLQTSENISVSGSSGGVTNGGGGNSSGGNTISISSPSNGSTIGSPVHFAASDPGAAAMHLYIDGSLAYRVTSNQIDTSVSVGSGGHNVVFVAWDSMGNVTQASENITVSGSSGGSTGGGGVITPGSATTISSIQAMDGWSSCTVCAGEGGNGPVTVYSMSQGISSPSTDGKATQFYLGGNVAWGAALWWREFTPANASNFVYDTYFYLQNPEAAQALEFDMNQNINNTRYMFGTECDIKGTHSWRVWDTANNRWVSTGITCSMPPAYTWNHLVLEFQRSGSQTVFVAVTVNGNKSYINRTFNAKASSGNELNVAFQMDGDGSYTGYSVWLDQVTFTYW